MLLLFISEVCRLRPGGGCRSGASSGFPGRSSFFNVFDSDSRSFLDCSFLALGLAGFSYFLVPSFSSSLGFSRTSVSRRTSDCGSLEVVCEGFEVVGLGIDWLGLAASGGDAGAGWAGDWPPGLPGFPGLPGLPGFPASAALPGGFWPEFWPGVLLPGVDWLAGLVFGSPPDVGLASEGWRSPWRSEEPVGFDPFESAPLGFPFVELPFVASPPGFDPEFDELASRLATSPVELALR